MQLEQPANALVLASLKRRGAGKPEMARHDGSPRAYLHSGCHPDMVERLWDGIGKALPADCRYLLYGTPCLAHPGGLILAVGIGTQYGLRIPVASLPAAKDLGAKTLTTWAGGKQMDIQADYGGDWIFGAWLAQELAWCQAVYAAANTREKQ